MKKIGIFSGYYPPHLGGVERYVEKMSAGLKKLGYEIVVITARHDDTFPLRENIEGVSIYRLPISRFAKNRYPIPILNKQYSKLMQELRMEEIDYYIVNTRFHLTSLLGARMGRRLRRPVLLIEHGTGHFTVNNKFLDFFGKIYEHLLTMYLKRYVDKYYGVSKECNKWLRHYSISADGVFYNAVDPASQKGVSDYYADIFPSDEILILYAGRLIKEKGVLNLLDAFLELRSKDPSAKVRLAIAGDGDLLETIKADYKDSNIELLGRLDFPRLMSLYKRSDIFVHPSLYPEGLPTSILEAGLMNCAIIATPSGGSTEVITDKQHGIIVDGGTESLILAIEQLIKDPNYRDQIAVNVKIRIEDRFSWDAVVRAVKTEINKFNTEA